MFSPKSPYHDEMQACLDYLRQQIDNIDSYPDKSLFFQNSQILEGWMDLYRTIERFEPFASYIEKYADEADGGFLHLLSLFILTRQYNSLRLDYSNILSNLLKSYRDNFEKDCFSENIINSLSIKYDCPYYGEDNGHITFQDLNIEAINARKHTFSLMQAMYELYSSIEDDINKLLDGRFPTFDDTHRAFYRNLKIFTRYYKEVEFIKIREELNMYYKANPTDPDNAALWGEMLKADKNAFSMALKGELSKCDGPKLRLWKFTWMTEEERDKQLLAIIYMNCHTGQLFNITNIYDRLEFFDHFSEDNFIAACEIITKHNLIQCEIFPELKKQHEEWLNNAKEQDSSQARSEDKKAKDSEEPNKVKNVLESFVGDARDSGKTSEKTWWYRLYAPMRELAMEEIKGQVKYKPFFTLMHLWFPKDTGGFDDENWSGVFCEEAKKWKAAKMIGHEHWAQHCSKGPDGIWTDIQRDKAKTAYQVWGELNAICKEREKR